MKDKKICRCRHSNMDMTMSLPLSYRCTREEKEYPPLTTEEQCENCPHFDSRYIEYPVTVTRIESKPFNEPWHFRNTGNLVKIRPCDEKYQGKTYLGLMLGELPIAITASLDKHGVLTQSAVTNPAIFVFELNKIVYGCESWWTKIDDISQMKEITDESIENTWYVQLMTDMLSRQKSPTAEPNRNEASLGD